MTKQPLGQTQKRQGDRFRVVVTDWNFTNLEQERAILADQRVDFEAHQCQTENELIKAVAGADAVLVQFAPITVKVIESLRDCRVIVRYGVGVDNIDLEAAAKHGVPVAYVPDYCLEEVAEHTTALLLNMLRRLSVYDASVRKNTWDVIAVGGNLLPLSKVTIGLIGIGRIGFEVIKRLRSFGCRLIAHDPFVSVEQATELGVELLDVEDLLRTSDAISLHMPLTDATHHFINASRLKLMKSNAIIVNTARGALIDTHELALALSNHQIGGAALDVFEEEPLPESSPLRRCPNLVFTPHAAWYSSHSIGRLQRLAAEEVRRALLGEPLRCPVKI